MGSTAKQKETVSRSDSDNMALNLTLPVTLFSSSQRKRLLICLHALTNRNTANYSDVEHSSRTT